MWKAEKVKKLHTNQNSTCFPFSNSSSKSSSFPVVHSRSSFMKAANPLSSKPPSFLPQSTSKSSFNPNIPNKIIDKYYTLEIPGYTYNPKHEGIGYDRKVEYVDGRRYVNGLDRNDFSYDNDSEISNELDIIEISSDSKEYDTNYQSDSD